MNRTLTLLAVLTLLLISVLPVGRTLLSAFLVEDGPGVDWDFTLDHVTGIFEAGRLKLLGNSILIGLVAAVLAVAVGVPYALLTARTDLPLRRLLGSAYVVPLVLPPLIVTLSWSFVPGFEPTPISAAGDPGPWAGTVAVLRAGAVFALCYYPLVVLFARRAFLRVPAHVEESAVLAAGSWRAVKAVTVPLAAPGILAGALFVFLFAVNDFAVVDFLNWVRPTGDRIEVYPFRAFTAWSKSHGEGPATALGLPLAATGVLLLFAIHRLVGRSPRSAVTSSLRVGRRFVLGRWRWPAFGLVTALFLVSAALPVVGLLVRSEGLHCYRAVWALVGSAETGDSNLLWTLWLAGGAAALSVPLAFVLAHRLARRGGTWLSVAALLPLALPPIFLGAGYVRLINHPALTFEFLGGGPRNPLADLDGPQYGAMLMMVAKFLPFALVALWAAILEIDPKLEEAAATAGVKPLDRILGILMPLLAPALGVAFVLVFAFAVREIDTVVLLTTKTVMRKIYHMMHYQRDCQVAALAVILLGLMSLPFLVQAILVRTPHDPARG